MMNGESKIETLNGWVFASGVAGFGLLMAVYADINKFNIFGIDQRNTQQIIKEAKKDASGWSNAGNYRVKNQRERKSTTGNKGKKGY